MYLSASAIDHNLIPSTVALSSGITGEKISEMKIHEPDPAQKITLLILNTVLWLSLCIRIIMHWHVTPWNLRLFGIYLAAVFPLLWRDLMRENSSFSLLMGVTLLFGGVLGLAVQAF